MKRRYRKPVLDLNGETNSVKRRWPQEGYYPNNRNGSPPEGDPQCAPPQGNQLNEQVNDFLAEIQSIVPNKPPPVINPNLTMNPASQWQECFDENTGYPYYWHTKTNQVTWEMPPELKALAESNNKESKPESSPIQQWPNKPSNNYPNVRNSIPDGMIPKEVVARNRFKQTTTSKTDQPPKPQTKQKRYPSHLEDTSDDGKIEMITSFGNDTESEESEEEKSSKKPKNMYNKPSKETSDALRENVFGPSLPLGSSSKLSDYFAKMQQPQNSSKSSRDREEDVSNRLKTHTYKSKEIKETTTVSFETSNNKKKPRDVKMSLVPGYDDDSEGDEESPRKQVPEPQQLHQSKPLFPIIDQPISSSSSNLKKDFKLDERVPKHIETPSGSIKVYDYRSETTEKSKDRSPENAETSELDRPEKDEPKIDLDTKANKFLESLDPPSRAFQRKKRIAFDVGSKVQESQDAISGNSAAKPPTNGDAESSKTEAGETRPKTEFSKGDDDSPKPVGDSAKKYNISFIKGETMNNAKTEKEDTPNGKELSEEEKEEFRFMTDSITEKLKFLSEGSTAVSAVQVMAIQLQTLMSAWEAKSLQDSYLKNWLKNTSCELSRLEQTAAPVGWECQWDRTHKRYYYRNTSTDESQWTYPQPDIAGGTEEMELCTTPPPPEHEEPPIIEMNVQAVKEKEKPNETEKETKADESVVPPPPPIISTNPPSPPPPPKIEPEDLKDQQQKIDEARRNAVRAKENVQREALKNEYKERKDLLPHPGVDPTEIAYALSNSAAFEALYGHQQINPIYAATLGGTGIPIISHHPALGQIMHYPAYQHLHNQALVARFSGQEAMQFMVPQEYAPQIYDNSQVITKPPVKAVVPESTLGSALNSFYSDIASIENNQFEQEQREKTETEPGLSVISAPPQIQQSEAEVPMPDQTKEKKKKKLIKTGIGKKQKEMSSMVAKWQKAQKNYKDN